MSIVTKNVLKSYFLEGSQPTQSNYNDLIDTLVSLVEANSIYIYPSGNVGINTDTSVDGGYGLTVNATTDFNQNIVVDQNISVTGKMSANNTSIGHLGGISTGFIAQSQGMGIGTGGSVIITGTDMVMQVTVTTGTGCLSSTEMFALQFGRSYTTIPAVFLNPYGNNSASLSGASMPLVQSVTNSGLSMSSNSIKLQDNSVYTLFILTIGN